MTGSLVSPETRQRIRGVALPVAMLFGRMGLTPNALTVIGFLIAIVAAVAAAGQAWLAAGLLVLVGGVFDLFDGALARATGTASRLGAFMDSVFDRWSEAVVYVGIVAGLLAAGWANAPLLATAALASSALVPYARAKSESLGFTPGTGMANVGLAPREVRIVILTAGLILAGVLGTAGGTTDGAGGGMLPTGIVALQLALGVITILATITTIQRIVHVIRQQQAQDQR